MRIQHNIMAMSAYRNYTNNVSAMKKNLEKLSSGYKINRAGDDAAGLAISEKMRAQITGLETAQKNAKDGISLVQTAEGALTEVHDMLNRMVELATQSANGTYDNTTDRAQMQKELEQLRSEINRIADSSNFNGITLLDGTWDAGGTTKEMTGFLPEVGEALTPDIGEKTILKGDDAGAKKTKFGVQFDNLAVKAASASDTLEVAVGSNTFTFKLKEGKNTAADLATALASAFASAGGTIGGQAFTATVSDTAVIFEQVNEPTGDADTVKGNMDVKIKFVPKTGDPVQLNDGIQTFEASGSSAISGTASSNISIDGRDAVAAVYQGSVAVGSTALAAGNVITIGAKSFTVIASGTVGANQVLAADVATKGQVMQFIVSNASVAGYTVGKSSDGSKLTFTATTAGTAGNTNKPTLAVSFKASAATSAAALTGYSVTVGSTATTAGAAAVTGTKTANASGLNKDAIKTAIDALGSGVTDGKVTIELNSTSNKLELKIGSNVIGTASAAIASTVTGSVSYNFATASGTALGTVKLSGSVGRSDITKALDTGLSYTAASGGGGGGGNTTVASANLVPSGVTIDFSSGTKAVAASAVTAMKNALPASGSMAGKILVSSEVEVNVKAALDSLGSNATTVKAVADALLAEAKKGAQAWNAANASASYTYENVRISTTAAGASGDIIAQSAGDGFYILMDKKAKGGGDSAGAGVSGSYNAATVTITQGNAEVADQRASTQFSLKDVFGDDIGDGSELKVGDETYKFVWGDANGYSGNTITLNKKLSGAAHIAYAAEAMSNMNNKAFSIGYEKDDVGKITFDEKKGNTNYAEDLKDYKKFNALFSAKVVTAKDDSKALTLQIGDTADDFNQLKVSIGSTKCEDLGIDKIRIDNQDDAATAIDAIKAAINTVSDIRGTLGATQNRLDHTINNLSVMTENIQDAESTIRDTDVADEMMAYTKNNILIQSAQAMLAQANQVPQGVLQLLQ